MNVLFTVWGYDMTALEFAGLMLALPAVVLGIRGNRWTWPFSFLSSLLYGWLFVEFDLFASAALQVIFMVVAIQGWFSWGKQGVLRPGRLTLAARIRGTVGVLAMTALIAPMLLSVGGVATWGDAFVLVGSLAGQLLMVMQKLETWPVFVTANTVGAMLYASQGLYFTSLFYAVLVCLAFTGWRSWSSRRKDLDVAPPVTAPA